MFRCTAQYPFKPCIGGWQGPRIFRQVLGRSKRFSVEGEAASSSISGLPSSSQTTLRVIHQSNYHVRHLPHGANLCVLYCKFLNKTAGSLTRAIQLPSLALSHTDTPDQSPLLDSPSKPWSHSNTDPIWAHPARRCRSPCLLFPCRCCFNLWLKKIIIFFWSIIVFSGSSLRIC